MFNAKAILEVIPGRPFCTKVGGLANSPADIPKHVKPAEITSCQTMVVDAMGAVMGPGGSLTAIPIYKKEADKETLIQNLQTVKKGNAKKAERIGSFK